MNRLIIFIALILTSIFGFAQEYNSWNIYHNRKEVSKFNDKKEPKDDRRVVLLNRLLEGPGFFIVEFNPVEDQKDWIRTIGFFDSSDKSIKEFSNTLFLRMHNSEIAEIMENREKVKVYSWALPKDPALAATVRVRRILLCTLYKR